MQTITETVGGREYTVTQIPAKRGLRLFNRLCRIFAPPAAKAFGSLAGELSLARFMAGGLGSFAEALVLLFEKLSEQEQEAILRELFEGARFRNDDGKMLPLWEHFDVAFAGRLAEVYLVAAFAMRVNFGSFSDALKAAASAWSAKAAAEEKAEPETTSG